MHGDPSSDDLRLLHRLRDGDADALRELMSRYDKLVRFAVFRVCRSECRRDGHFLDSRASETWSGFVESVRRRDAPLPRNLKTYLLQIVRNKCIDALRRTGRPDAGLEECGSLEAPAEPTVEILIRAEQMTALRACIVDLTGDEQRIYEQIELILDGRWKQSGEVLGIPESTLRTRWPGIVQKLKACLKQKMSKSPAPTSGSRDS